jgi:hypothetical protein
MFHHARAIVSQSLLHANVTPVPTMRRNLFYPPPVLRAFRWRRRIMRGFAAYMLGGALAMTAMNFVAPALGVSLSPSFPAGPAIAKPAQTVNRVHKTDRLDLHQSTIGQRPNAPAAPPDGCEASVSAMSASALAGHVVQRCVT